MINYVISLRPQEGNNIRRQHIQTLFNDRNIPFEFFNAISPSNGLEETIERFAPNLKQVKKLTDGEKSCFMSHVSLWQKCIDENMPYIAIFEDDILLGENAEKFLTDYTWFEERFYLSKPIILKLETALCKTNYRKLKISELNSRYFVKLIYGKESVHFGTAGYIISKVAAEILIQKIKSFNSNEFRALDLFMFDDLLKEPNFQIIQISPAICVQELFYNKTDSKLTSSLDKERHLFSQTKQRKRKTWLERLHRIITSPYRKLMRLQRRKIPFK